MKKFIIILIIFLSCFCTVNSQWTKVCDLYSGGAEGFADNGSYIYAVLTGDGVYRSTNDGVNWTLIYSGFGSNNLNTIVAKDSFVFVGSDQGLFRSSNYGYNWLCVKNASIISLTILNKNNTDNLIAGGLYLFKTTNYGDNWITITSGIPKYPFIRALTNSEGFLYAGITTSSIDSTGIYKSTNYGDNWTIMSQGYNIDPRSLYSYSNLVISGGTKVYISTDYGYMWHNIPEMFNIINLYGITSLGIKDIFISSWDNGCYVSNDTGATWQLKNEGLGNLKVTALYRYGNYLYVSLNPLYGNGGIYRRPISEVIGINNISTEIPNSSILYQNYPNPFNSKSKIKYQIGRNENGKWNMENSFVVLKVFNILGKEVATLVNEKQNMGTYEVLFDAENLQSGVYFYTFEIDGMKYETKKLLYVK
jgi:hypothetical protein